MSGALKQDWGDYSDLLRKAFHHECVSFFRKSGERYEIEHPAISVVLAGTLGQVSKLIPDLENGLFSRFLFYCYQAKPVWRDVSPQPGRPSLNDTFSRLAESVKDMALALNDMGDITFDFTTEQWTYLNTVCPVLLSDALDDTAPEFSSTVFRLGLIIYRLAMVLSLLHLYGQRRLMTTIVCDGVSLGIAVDMAKVLLEHSKIMYGTLSPTSSHRAERNQMPDFLQLLPDAFDRAKANAAEEKLTLTNRTVTNYLRFLVLGGQLRKLEHGKYQKT